MDGQLGFIIGLIISNVITLIVLYLMTIKLEDERFKLIVSQNREIDVCKRLTETEDELTKTKDELKRTNDSLHKTLNRCYEAELKNQKVLEVFCDKGE